MLAGTHESDPANVFYLVSLKNVKSESALRKSAGGGEEHSSRYRKIQQIHERIRSLIKLLLLRSWAIEETAPIGQADTWSTDYRNGKSSDQKSDGIFSSYPREYFAEARSQVRAKPFITKSPTESNSLIHSW